MTEQIDKPLGNVPFGYTVLNTFDRCPRKYGYKYLLGLERREETLPLTRGTWVHKVLEAYNLAQGIAEGTLLDIPSNYEITLPEVDEPFPIEVVNLDTQSPYGVIDVEGTIYETYAPHDESFKVRVEKDSIHGLLARRHDSMFDEERELFVQDEASLPEQIEALLFNGYLNYHEDRLANRNVLAAEVPWSIDGMFEGTADVLYTPKDQPKKVHIDDYKTKSRIPSDGFQLLDAQLVLYAVGLSGLIEQHVGQDAQTWIGVDYIRTKMPGAPRLNKDGSLSKRKTSSIRAYATGVFENLGLDLNAPEVVEWMERFVDDAAWFHYSPVPLLNTLVNQVLSDLGDKSDLLLASWESAMEQRDDEGNINLDNTPFAERRRLHACEWDCDYYKLCLAHLLGNDGAEEMQAFTTDDAGEEK